MALAIFQKLQDTGIVGSLYVELQNKLKACATTCDGYEVLKELLRHVHPKLEIGKVFTSPPKLSDCENDLFIYSDALTNFFTAEATKRRPYTEKEKSEMFLQHIDDPRYDKAVSQCDFNLGIATTGNGNVINLPNLIFSSLYLPQ